MKKAEDSDDIILRMHEAHGESTKTKLEFGYSILQAFECDLMENVAEKLKPSKSILALKFGRYEIKTLKVKLKARKRSR